MKYFLDKLDTKYFMSGENCSRNFPKTKQNMKYFLDKLGIKYFMSGENYSRNFKKLRDGASGADAPCWEL